MEDVAEAFRDEPQIRRFSPDEEVQRHVEKLSPEVDFAGSAVVVDPEVGLLTKVRAPRAVILEELFTETAEDSSIKSVDVVRRRSKPHLSIGEVEDKVLTLITDVILLEPEEESQPVEQVHVRPPLAKRRTPEVTYGAKCCGGCTDLGEAE